MSLLLLSLNFKSSQHSESQSQCKTEINILIFNYFDRQAHMRQRGFETFLYINLSNDTNASSEITTKENSTVNHAGYLYIDMYMHNVHISV
jgi:hypothetical protein